MVRFIYLPMTPKAKKILKWVVISILLIGISALAYFAFIGYLIGQAFAGGDNFTEVVVGDPPITYVVNEWTGFQRESDVHYFVYKKDGKSAKTQIGSSGGLLFIREGNYTGRGIDPRSTSTVITIYSLLPPPPDEGGYRLGDPIFYYKPATKELIPVEKTLTEFDTSNNLDKLVKYKNHNLGISFDYPEAYKNTVCDVTVRYEEPVTIIGIGSRTELSVEATDNTNANISRLVKKDLKDVLIEKQTPITLAGKNATQVSYRFGGMNRYGETVYLIDKNRLYKLGFTAGGFACGFEPGVYEKIMESFNLND